MVEVVADGAAYGRDAKHQSRDEHRLLSAEMVAHHSGRHHAQNRADQSAAHVPPFGDRRQPELVLHDLGRAGDHGGVVAEQIPPIAATMARNTIRVIFMLFVHRLSHVKVFHVLS